MKPRITSMSNDGVVAVLINDQEYLYFMDTGHYDHIKALFNRKPWAGLNFLKTKCKDWEKGEKQDGVQAD